MDALDRMVISPLAHGILWPGLRDARAPPLANVPFWHTLNRYNRCVGNLIVRAISG